MASQTPGNRISLGADLPATRSEEVSAFRQGGPTAASSRHICPQLPEASPTSQPRFPQTYVSHVASYPIFIQISKHAEPGTSIFGVLVRRPVHVAGL